MRLRRNASPIDYGRLCRQTVTVYHKEGEVYTQKVYTQAFLDRKKTVSVDKTGSKEANSFLLVIPGSTQTVFPEDKVYEGYGPGISDSKAWASFIPSKDPNVVVVKYADPKKWNDVIVHTEAGG